MTVIHGGNVWQGQGPEAWLDFSANLNPEGPPAWVREAMAQGLSRANVYPDLTGAAARQARRRPAHLSGIRPPVRRLSERISGKVTRTPFFREREPLDM